MFRNTVAVTASRLYVYPFCNFRKIVVEITCYWHLPWHLACYEWNLFYCSLTRSLKRVEIHYGLSAKVFFSVLQWCYTSQNLLKLNTTLNKTRNLTVECTVHNNIANYIVTQMYPFTVASMSKNWLKIVFNYRWPF